MKIEPDVKFESTSNSNMMRVVKKNKYSWTTPKDISLKILFTGITLQLIMLVIDIIFLKFWLVPLNILFLFLTYWSMRKTGWRTKFGSIWCDSSGWYSAGFKVGYTVGSDWMTGEDVTFYLLFWTICIFKPLEAEKIIVPEVVEK